MRFVTLAFAATLSLMTPAFADPLSPDVAAAVQERIDSFNGIMASGDLTGTIDFTPPTLLTFMATSFGTTPDAMRGQMRDALKATQDQVTFDSFSMSLASAEQATTPDGSRVYVMIPTESVLSVEGSGKVKSVSQTLAIEEEGQWYLISIADANQATMIQGAYPEFADVALPAGTITPVQ
ncbi:MAG: hypothetical protein ACRCSU_09430 [Paracoccaceae bacterium]